jgi:hypothetical protein
MKFVSRFAAAPIGFTVLLAAGIGLLLLALGLRPDALPYPPSQGVPTAQQIADLPAGWPFSDAIISHWPAALFLQRAVQSGALPLWRPLLMSGQPFAANPLNKVWYPPQWLVVILPVTLHLNLLIWLHLVLAGAGMRALGRRLGLGVAVASVIGVAYALTPRLAAATGVGHLDILYAAAWFPWVLWATHHAVTGERSIGRRAAVLGIVSGLCFLADVRLSLFIFVAGTAFGLWLIAHGQPSRRSSGLASLVAGAALAAGLTAVEWLPLLAIVPYLSRSGVTAQDSSAFSLWPQALIGLIFPDRGGFHETMVYVGIVVLVLAVIGLLHSPRRHLLWGLLVLGAAWYSLGDQGLLWSTLVRLAPPLLWFRVPARAWIVVVVPLLILAGFGLEGLIAPRARRSAWSLPGVALIGFGVTFGLAGAMLPLRPGAAIAATVGLLAMGALLLAREHLRTGILVAAVGGLIVLDLVWIDVTLVKWLPQSAWLDPYANVAQALLDASVTRLYSPDYSLPQQVAAYWNIPDFGGVDPFQLEAYVTAFEAATGVRATGYTVTLPAFNDPDLRAANRQAVIDADRLGQWDVSHVLSSFPLDVAGLRLVRKVDGLYLYENTRCPADVTLTWDGPNRFTARNQSDQTVNLVAYAPGWESTGSDTALTIAPGQTLTRQYESPGLVPGLGLSLISLLIAGVASRTGHVPAIHPPA